MGAASRRKGATAELEIIGSLQLAINDTVPASGIVLQRNLVQTREGGYDVIGVPWLALEVKRHETLSLGVWWQQALSQACGRVPVLAYRQNRTPWRVRMLLDAYGRDIIADLSIHDFLSVFRGMLTDPRYGVKTT